MNVIAWICTGLAAGLVVGHLAPGGKGHGRTAAYVIGVAGALIGGWIVTSLLPTHSTAGLVAVASELGALASAVIALAISHQVTRRSGLPDAGLPPALKPPRPSRASR